MRIFARVRALAVVGALAGLLLSLSQAARADELTLYFYPSARGLDFSTPKSLTQSTIANELARDSHSIGHVNVEVRCDPVGDAAGAHVWTGMTNADGGEPRRLLLEERYGLGILFHDFAGRLYTEAEIRAELPGRYESGRLSFLTYRISPEACARLVQYVAEYDERGYDEHYGLPNRPLHGEGAGCSAFAASFLDVAGLLADGVLERQWTRFLRVPAQYVGGPLTGQRVYLRRLLLSLRNTRWAEPHEAHFPIYFWDPELMHAWTQRAWNGQAPMPNLAVTRVMRGRAVGLVLDGRAVPTPRGDIWRN